MDVQTGARIFLERLGHEAGDETVLPRHGFYRPFKQYRVVAGKHRIIDMVQIDLELAWRELGRRRTRRNILGLTGRVQVVQEVFDIPEVIRMVDLRARLRPSDTGYT